MTDDIGLRFESAASIVARDVITKHVNMFAHVLRGDRIASQSTASAYVDGLAAVVALAIIGRFGSQAELTEATVKTLREAIERDLKHLGPR